ncbi:MAG: hypothetical protein HY295_04780 [Thaumarchaeota archaeon]|nr:hypothetical protein [Nitrososphaerota archaeon]
MTEERQAIIKKNGHAAAAMISAMIGILSLAVSHVFSLLSKESSNLMLEVGKTWIPGAEGIGPYSGKETFMLIGWFSSWLILYFVLRNRDVKLSHYGITFMIGVGISTLLVWAPFLDLLK